MRNAKCECVGGILSGRLGEGENEGGIDGKKEGKRDCERRFGNFGGKGDILFNYGSILGFLAPLKKKKLVKPKKGKKNETAITPSFRKCISALGAGPHCEMCMVIVSKGIQNLPDWQGPPLSRAAREWKKGGEGIRFIFAFICCC